MNWNLHLLHSSSKHVRSNASIDGTHLRVKGLHISALVSIGWIGRFEGRHDIAYGNLSGETRSLDSVIVEDWKNC
jgi:hypothetical protein